MQQRLKLGILTYVHFCVDFVCAFWVNYIILFDGMSPDRSLLMSSVSSAYAISNGNRLFWVMLYNFCAFAMQLPLGMLLDRLRSQKPWWVAAFGCVLIGIAGVMGFRPIYHNFPQMIAIFILLGLGNAFFHVGAGVRVMQMGERMTPLGVFISTGALGVCLGTMFSGTFGYDESLYKGIFAAINDYEENFTLFVLMLLLSFAPVVALLLGSKMDSLQTPIPKNGRKYSNCISAPKSGRKYLKRISIPKNGQRNSANAVIIFLLFLVVALRSFQGSFAQFSWKSGISITLLFALCIVAGKALGGVLADRFGVPVALVPLFLSALLFLKSEDMLPGLGAILLFQTTMPVTLSLMQKQLPAMPGTAFGLLSFALFVGYLPKFLARYAGIKVHGPRLHIGDWSFYQFCFRMEQWWMKCHIGNRRIYTYSIVTGISFLLLVLLLYLYYRVERKGEGNERIME